MNDTDIPLDVRQELMACATQNGRIGYDWLCALYRRSREEPLAILREILAEPFGCSLCDSGVPRNPAKGHQPDCPYGRAQVLMGAGPTAAVLGRLACVETLHQLVEQWRVEAADAQARGYHETWLARSNDADQLAAVLGRLAPETQPEAQAWICYERGLDGQDRIEGIALSHEAKEQFMRGYFEPGQSRSALPYKVLVHALTLVRAQESKSPIHNDEETKALTRVAPTAPASDGGLTADGARAAVTSEERTDVRSQIDEVGRHLMAYVMACQQTDALPSPAVAHAIALLSKIEVPGVISE